MKNGLILFGNLKIQPYIKPMRENKSAKAQSYTLSVSIILAAIIILGFAGFGIQKYFELRRIDAALTESSNLTKAQVWMDRATKAHETDNHDAEIEYLLKSAKLDYSPAIFKLGTFYDTGDHLPLSYEKAQEWYSKLPKQKYAQYLARRGRGLIYPQISLEQSRLGIEFLEQALSLDENDRVRKSLAEVYYRSYSELEDMKKAEEYYTIIGGDPELNFLIHRGTSFKHTGDYDNAKTYYQRAYDKGSPTGLIRLAEIYQNDRKDPNAHKIAEALYDEGSQSKYPWTRYRSAKYFFRFGDKDKQNRSLNILEELADSGFSKASQFLAKVYISDSYARPNYIKAAKYLEQSTYLPPALNLTLGHMKRTGTGVKVDLDTALAIYTKEKDNGNSEGMLALAHMYRLGIGTKKDSKKALSLYQKARANTPRHSASYYIGLMHENGELGLTDDSKAIEFYSLASEVEYGPALRRLAQKYEKGDGVSKNTTKAFNLMTEAAYAHDQEAIENLVRYFKNGIGTEINLEIADLWSKKQTIGPFQFPE